MIEVVKPHYHLRMNSMRKVSHKSVAIIVIVSVIIVIFGTILQRPNLGLFLGVAACLKTTSVSSWRQGAKYGGILGGISYAFMFLINGLIENYDPAQSTPLLVIPLVMI
ncbi:MAG: hypothetical protein AAF629_25775, partial [Chloroflexota bacterium]